MIDCLWQFMWNIRQHWNQDMMAFLCTGRVVKALTFESEGPPSNPQFCNYFPLYSSGLLFHATWFLLDYDL